MNVAASPGFTAWLIGWLVIDGATGALSEPPDACGFAVAEGVPAVAELAPPASFISTNRDATKERETGISVLSTRMGKFMHRRLFRINQIVFRCIIFKLRSPWPNPKTLEELLHDLRQIPHAFLKLENTTPLSLHFTPKSEPHLDKSGDLNESTQHLLEVYFQESKKLKSFAALISRMEYSVERDASLVA